MSDTEKQYRVVASGPQGGAGSSLDSRRIGPFFRRGAAEDAAARLVDDPRRYERINIITEDREEQAEGD